MTIRPMIWMPIADAPRLVPRGLSVFVSRGDHFTWAKLVEVPGQKLSWRWPFIQSTKTLLWCWSNTNFTPLNFDPTHFLYVDIPQPPDIPPQ